MTTNITHPQLNYRPKSRKSKKGRKQIRVEKSAEKFADKIIEANTAIRKKKAKRPRSGISRKNSLEPSQGGVRAGWNAWRTEFEKQKTMGERPDLKRNKKRTGKLPACEPHPQRVKNGCA